MRKRTFNNLPSLTEFSACPRGPAWFSGLTRNSGIMGSSRIESSGFFVGLCSGNVSCCRDMTEILLKAV